VGPGRDLAEHVLSYIFGEKRGKGDLRDATQAKLLEVALELKVLRKENNRDNYTFWGVMVDKEGNVDRDR